MKHFRTLLLLIILTVPGNPYNPLYAQKRGQVRLDSLEQELTSRSYRNREDSVKLLLLDNLSFSYYPVNPDKGIKSGMQELELAKKIKRQKFIGYAYDDIAVNYQYKSDYRKALIYFDSAVMIYEQLKDDDHLAGSFGSIGYAYTLSGDFEKALAYDLKALQVFERKGDKSKQATALGNIGSLYMNKGDYAKALDYSFKALKINESSDDRSSIANNLGGIGSIYVMQQNYPKALDYYFKALKINTEVGKKSGAAGNYANIGSVYNYEGDYSKALQYSFSALNIYEEMGAKTGMALVLGDVGEIYGNLHDYGRSIAFIFRALGIARETGDKNAEAGQLGMIGQSYLHMVTDTAKSNAFIIASHYSKQYVPDSIIPKNKKEALYKALEYETLAIEHENQVGNLNYEQQFRHTLSQIDSMLGNYKGALDAYEQYTNLQDSIFNGENKIKITNLETKRAMDLKQKQIEIDELDIAKKRNERWFFITAIFFLTVIGLLFINRQRLQQKRLEADKKNAEMEKANAESDLAAAQKQLDMFRQSIQEKNNLIEQFSSDLTAAGSNTVKPDIEMITQLERSIILTDEQWENFKELFEKVHKGFFARLRAKLPDLTQAEVRFLSLTKLNLSPKEMASMLGISPNAIRMYRYRLRKKMELDKEEMIEELIWEL